ncbi:hypothetical protein GCM10007094_22720 [Pseudovibrio japonicus]|uniref:DUF2336 domain-containing protein n=1 Tax=Pseudovibrio japonicus TaxID=366534 RepID=A0ABQ3EI93_9HYPH|nr:DUF2336 domain-containing protein [Pseudovibrio japonicus]GHB33164.1 hypothetical protein GCM10007094_22720 [Pseudovibrio japonicus]
MIIKSFLHWVQYAPSGSRAQAAGALARAFLYSDLDGSEREEAEAALTFLLDDHDVAVRVALAEVFGAVWVVPAHILSALLVDEDEVALPLLSGFTTIPEGELVDLVATGSADRCVAVASRAEISVSLSAAICEVACEEACVALLANNTAQITSSSMERIVGRFGGSRDVKDALMSRDDVPLQTRHMMLRRYTESLRDHPQVLGARNMRAPEQLVADAQDRSTISLAWSASDRELPGLVEHLVVSAQMTSVLLLRAAVTGCFNLLTSSLARLSEYDQEQVFDALASPFGAVLPRILSAAGLPVRTHALFQECIASWQRVETMEIDHWSKSRLVVADLIALEDDLGIEDLGDLQDLLHRLSNEAARESARTRVALMMSDVA